MDDGCLDAEELSSMMDMDHVMDVWMLKKKEGDCRIDGRTTKTVTKVEVPQKTVKLSQVAKKWRLQQAWDFNILIYLFYDWYCDLFASEFSRHVVNFDFPLNSIASIPGRVYKSCIELWWLSSPVFVSSYRIIPMLQLCEFPTLTCDWRDVVEA